MTAGTRFGWDAFLTERDTKHLAAGWNKPGPFGFGSRPALLIVDAYYASVGAEREPILDSVRRWPMSCGLEGWAAIDRTVPVLEAARAAGVPAIFVKGMDAGFPSPWARQTVTVKVSEEDRRLGNQIVREIEPAEGELVLQKAAPSAFSGTPLEFHLSSLQIDTLIVVGETTSGCVRASVVDAATHRYRVGIVADCCFDRTEASHYVNLYDMDQKYGDVIDSAEAASYLQSVKPVIAGKA